MGSSLSWVGQLFTSLYTNLIHSLLEAGVDGEKRGTHRLVQQLLLPPLWSDTYNQFVYTRPAKATSHYEDF